MPIAKKPIDAKPNNFRIAAMQPQHLPNVLQIETRVFHIAPWSKNGFLKAKHDSFVVHNDDGPFVGYLILEFQKKDHTLLVVKMARDTAETAKGAGSFIMAELMKIATLRAAKRIFLHVRLSNTLAIDLYLRSGFRLLPKVGENYKGGNRQVDRVSLSMEYLL